MDARGEEREERPADASGSRDERARAAAYLDLWERQVVLVALHGPAAPAVRTPSGSGA